jgi:hypothetical protein
MIRMGGADAFMLAYETPRSYMHTFKVAILDPSTDPEGWSYEKFYKDFEDRLHLVPMFRWKYARSPLGINHPMWVDDPRPVVTGPCANSCRISTPTSWIGAGHCG